MGQLYLIGLLVLFTITLSARGFPAESFVTTTEALPTPENSNKDGAEGHTKTPKIYQMHIKSDVCNRYANTTIASKVKNLAKTSQEAVFAVVLPENAFISGFIMEIGGKNYSAYVKEKEEAKQIYNKAKDSGIGAAHVDVSARDSNRFTVSANIEPESKAAFYLTYEELLQRKDGVYELVINIHPGQPVKDLDVEVNINETRKLKDLKTPPLRSGNEIGNENSELDPRADISIINETNAVVKFKPSIEKQKNLAEGLGTKIGGGLAGQFVVQYDVERDPKGGEVLVKDGYFVHFFAPSDIPPLDKHVVFILDTSISMEGDKMEQLKEAMSNILNELKPNDLFNVIEFNTNVKVWNLDDPYNNDWAYDEMPQRLMLPPAYAANPSNIIKAKDNVEELEPNGGTNIYDALLVGLNMVNSTKNNIPGNSNIQPLIIFLTDGEATIGVVDSDNIINGVKDFTAMSAKCPIFSLSFGDSADKNFLQKLSSQNLGFSRHIYEAADASLQLQDFYKQISSPLLSDVNFKYQPSVTSLTTTNFPIHFDGSELVVAGWCGKDFLYPEIDGFGINGPIRFTPVIERAISSTERLWAYITIQQLINRKDNPFEDQDELEKMALELALKYSFVTPLTSFVVVKPNDTTSVDTEKADKKERVFVPHAQSFVGHLRPVISPLAGDFNSFNSPAIFVHNRAGNIGWVVEEPAYEDPFEVDDLLAPTTAGRSSANPSDSEEVTTPATTPESNKPEENLTTTTIKPGVANDTATTVDNSIETELPTTSEGNTAESNTTLKPDGENNATTSSTNATDIDTTTAAPLDNTTERHVLIYTLKADDVNSTTSSSNNPAKTPTDKTPEKPSSIKPPISSTKAGATEETPRGDTSVTTPLLEPTSTASTTESTDELQLLTTANPIVGELPWLEQVLNENETITLQYGEYPLGLNETINDIIDCPLTPLNGTGTGHCKLLNACPSVNSLVTSLEVFIKHFCWLQKKYAGICCPPQ